LPCDLTRPEAVDEFVLEARPNVVVHLAGIAFVAHGNAEDFYRVNPGYAEPAAGVGKA
jgi:GDP-6-deoxy-D-talose 4-dehydrogenase